MGKIARTPGMRPGETRDADEFNAWMNEVLSQLGEKPAARGNIEIENFSEFSGIQETKVDWSATGHNHDVGVSAKGAKIAVESITDYQLRWWDNTNPMNFIRGVNKAPQIRYGFWNNLLTKEIATPPTVFPLVATGGWQQSIDEEVDSTPEVAQIYFSEGHAAPYSSAHEEGTANFPPGSIPTVVFSPVVYSGFFDSWLLLLSINYPVPEGRISFAVESVTSEFFTISYHIPSDTGFDRYYINEGIGFNWIAFWDVSHDAEIF